MASAQWPEEARAASRGCVQVAGKPSRQQELRGTAMVRTARREEEDATHDVNR